MEQARTETSAGTPARRASGAPARAARVARCEGAGCRRAAGPGRRVGGRSRLCGPCRDEFAAQLTSLPELHEECGRLLGGSTGPRDRTSGGPLPGMPFNAEAAEVRSAILGVLGSWSGLVAEQRGVAAPGRTAGALAVFLHRHVPWLAAHEAAGEVSGEVAALVRRARRVAHPDPLRRVPLGGCVEAGCDGTLIALIRPEDPRLPAEIGCDAQASHRWRGAEWTQLGRRMRPARPAAGARSSRAEWLTADDVALLWDLAPGSVYRLASERHWRRRSRAGRTYYCEADVRETLAGRGARRTAG